MGDAHFKHGNYNEAARAFGEVIRINQGHVLDAYNGIGAAFCKLERYPEAVEAFKGAIECNPEHANAYFNMGNAHHHLGF